MRDSLERREHIILGQLDSRLKSGRAAGQRNQIMSENGNDPFGYNRRDFLKSGSFATLMTMMGGVELLGQSAPASAENAKTSGPKIKVAVIGLGDWGRRILTELMRWERADVA